MDWRRIFLKLFQMVAFQLQIQKLRLMRTPGPSGVMKQIILNLVQLLKIGDLEELQTELGGIIQQWNLLEARWRPSKGWRDTYEASPGSERGWTRTSSSTLKGPSRFFQPSLRETAEDDGTSAKPKEEVWLLGREPPTCRCRNPCIYEITKTKDPNEYQLFRGCLLPKCEFFQWLQKQPAWNGRPQDAAGESLLRILEPDCTHPELTEIGSSATACKVRCKICKAIIYDEVTDNPEDNPLGMAHNKFPPNKPENQIKVGPSPKQAPQPPKEVEVDPEWDLYLPEYRKWLESSRW